jgi:predicted small lipoprotein YifL
VRVAAKWVVLIALVAALGGCGDMPAPETPRDATGRAVDPVYGTPAPGTMSYGGGM